MWTDFKVRRLDEEARSPGKQRGGAGWGLSFRSLSSVSSAGGNGHCAALLALQGSQPWKWSTQVCTSRVCLSQGDGKPKETQISGASSQEPEVLILHFQGCHISDVEGSHV